jgi:hypothetical protein
MRDNVGQWAIGGQIDQRTHVARIGFHGVRAEPAFDRQVRDESIQQRVRGARRARLRRGCDRWRCSTSRQLRPPGAVAGRR